MELCWKGRSCFGLLSGKPHFMSLFGWSYNIKQQVNRSNVPSSSSPSSFSSDLFTRESLVVTDDDGWSSEGVPLSWMWPSLPCHIYRFPLTIAGTHLWTWPRLYVALLTLTYIWLQLHKIWNIPMKRHQAGEILHPDLLRLNVLPKNTDWLPITPWKTWESLQTKFQI